MPYHISQTFENDSRDSICSLAFSPDGANIASGQTDRLVIWCVRTGKSLHSVKTRARVLTLNWSMLFGRSIITFGLQDGEVVSLWIRKESISAMGFTAHEKPVECMTSVTEIDPKNKSTRLATGAGDEVIIWGQTLSSGSIFSKWSRVAQLPPPQKTIFSCDGQIIVTSLQWCGKPSEADAIVASYMYHGIVAYECSGFGLLWTIPTVLCADAALSPSGQFIAISNVVSGFDIYEASKAKLERQLHSTSAPEDGIDRPVPIRYIHNGGAVIGGSSTGLLKIWDVSTGKTLQALEHEGLVQALATHYDATNGSLIATGVSGTGSLSPVMLWKENVNRKAGRPKYKKTSVVDQIVTAVKIISLALLLSTIGTGVYLFWVKHIYARLVIYI